MKFHPVEPNYSCGRAIGEIGKHDETGSPFGNFSNASKKYILHIHHYRALVDNYVRRVR